MREMSEFVPTLRVDEIADGVRLSLHGVCSADGPTLQEAADALVWTMLEAVMAFRSRGLAAFSGVCRPRPEVVNLLWELEKTAAAGGDIRELLFGPSSGTAA
jgi:hypothetical protein